MDRSVLLSLSIVAVVVVAGLGAFDAGFGTGAGADAGTEPGTEASAAIASSTPEATAGASTTRTATRGTHSAKTPRKQSMGTNDTATDPSNTVTADPTSVNGATSPSATTADSSSVDTTDPPDTGTITYPPGTSSDGIERPSELLGAHTDALSRTGFVVTSTVNATVLETGMRIDATARGGARVAADVSAYYAHRTDAAGPLKRRTQGYYNGRAERHRRVGEFGSVRESTRKARSIGELAGRPLLAPHLRGGAWNATRAQKRGEESLVVFAATEVENASALESGLPAATTAVRSYDARAVVDSVGRVRSLTATVVYAIGGEPATFRLDYDLSRIGDASVERPDWAENRRGTRPTTGDRPGADAADSGRTVCPGSRVLPTVRA